MFFKIFVFLTILGYINGWLQLNFLHTLKTFAYTAAEHCYESAQGKSIRSTHSRLCWSLLYFGMRTWYFSRNTAFEAIIFTSFFRWKNCICSRVVSPKTLQWYGVQSRLENRLDDEELHLMRGGVLQCCAWRCNYCAVIVLHWNLEIRAFYVKWNK